MACALQLANRIYVYSTQYAGVRAIWEGEKWGRGIVGVANPRLWGSRYAVARGT